MKNLISTLSLCTCTCVLGLWIGSMLGSESGKKSVYYGEFKVCQANLKVCEQRNVAPALLEYVKMRTYYFSTYVPADWLDSSLDYGPVAVDLIPEMMRGKDFGNSDADYEALKEKIEANEKK